MTHLMNYVIAGLLVASASTAQANWTLNIGYQNPAVSTWGVNFLYLGSKWGFEAGIGWIDAEANVDDDDDENDDELAKGDEDDDRASLRLAGDVDLKYFLTSGSARVFLQGGVGVGAGIAAGDDGGAGAGTGGGFGGVGVLLGSPSFYGYGSFNVNGSSHTFVQAGLGLDI